MSDVKKPCLAHLRFHGELIDFFHVTQSPHEVTLEYHRAPSIKDAVESSAPPHAEVGLILHDGRPVSFSHLVRANAGYDVYPHHNHPPVDPSDLMPIAPQGRPRFILDVHLGILARYLRMLGFDCWYQAEDPGDARIAQIAGDESRIALSRDLGLLKRAVVRYGRWIRNTDPEKQLTEAVQFFQLQSLIQPFGRCMTCNHLLESAPKEELLDRIPPAVAKAYDEFSRCSGCDKIYWKGSHYERLMPLIEANQA